MQDIRDFNSCLGQGCFRAVGNLCFDAFLVLLSITGMLWTEMQRQRNPGLGLACLGCASGSASFFGGRLKNGKVG